MGLINTEKIERIIKIGIASGYIKDNDSPLSIILIAHPESGKTRLIELFKSNHSIETSDLSAKAITDVIIPLLEQEKIHHILIPDFIKILSHKNVTVDSTMAFLNALMEEGIKQQLFYGQMFQMKKRRKCGIITSITFDYYYKIFRKWHDIGFLSRFLPISFVYSTDTITKINHEISRESTFNELNKLKNITKKTITIPNDISDKLNFIVNQIVNNQKNDSIRISVRGGKQKLVPINIYGFRLHKQLRKMLKTITLLDGKSISTWDNMNELLMLVDYIRLPKNPKEI